MDDGQVVVDLLGKAPLAGNEMLVQQFGEVATC